MACGVCRDKKVKCDLEKPICAYCKIHNTICDYPSRRKSSGTARRGVRRRRLDESHHQTSSSTSNPTRCILQAHSLSNINGKDHGIGTSPSHDRANDGVLNGNGDRNGSCTTDGDSNGPRTAGIDEILQGFGDSPTVGANSVNGNSARVSGRRTEGETPELIDRILECEETQRIYEDYGTLSGDQEYAGSSSEMAIFCDPALDWILECTSDPKGVSTLRAIGQQMGTKLTFSNKQLSGLSFCPSKDRPLWPLPDPELARTYIDAYFEKVQCILPLLHRPEFSKDLDAFVQTDQISDVPWYALYNTVLALGCRAIQMTECIESPSSFQDSENVAWQYFYNAFGVHMELLYHKNHFIAIQALTAMVLFIQGIASPQVEYMLCSLAVRLAEQKGYHQRPHQSWGLTPEEIAGRNRLFWVLYWLDKTISLRSGRPSGIVDADISCDFPLNVPDFYPANGYHNERGSSTDSTFDFFLCITRYARICSKVRRLLYSATVFTYSAHTLFTIVHELDRDIGSWYQLVPSSLVIDVPVSMAKLPRGRRFIQAVVLHSCYKYLVCSVHCRLTRQVYWTRRYRGEEFETADIRRLERSVEASVKAARSIILLTRYVDVDNYTPSWLLFYYPFTALTIVFCHVIANPLLPTARNDIALMDVATGLFGRLDFVSSGLMSCSESGEFKRLALATVDRAISNHKDHLLDGYHRRNPIDVSPTPHASSHLQRPDPFSRSSNSCPGNSVAGAMLGADINPVGGMEFGLSSGNRVIEGVNVLPAKDAQLGISGDHGDMLTGFEWENMDQWPDPGPDYVQTSLSY